MATTRRRRWSAGLVGGVTLVVAWLSPAIAQTSLDWKRCGGGAPASRELQIQSCTAVIQSGRESSANLAIAFYNRGNGYLDRSELDLAIRDYDQAVRLDPKHASAFNNRGAAYGRKRDLDRALQDYSQAIRLNPGDASVFEHRGLTYSIKGEIDRAIRDLDEAIQLDPKRASAFHSRGAVFVSKGEHGRAIRDFDQAIRLRPADADAWNDRCWSRAMSASSTLRWRTATRRCGCVPITRTPSTVGQASI